MELVYLWVEEYKNIHKQGFNFSPRFMCSYENDELKIVDKEVTKEPYLKNFFPKNINVTAIVGKNGSGKSSIQKLIFLLIYFKKHEINTSNKNIQRILNFTIKDSYLINKNIFLIIKHDGVLKKISLLHIMKILYKPMLFQGCKINDIYCDKVRDCTLDTKKYPELDSKEVDFFSINFNYMIDTLYDDIYDEWVKTIYHKSDDYETPLLLEPHKGDDEQVINIDRLEYLNNQKILNLKNQLEDSKQITSFFKPNRLFIQINYRKLAQKYIKIWNDKTEIDTEIITALMINFQDLSEINKLYIALKIFTSNKNIFENAINQFKSECYKNESYPDDIDTLKALIKFVDDNYQVILRLDDSLNEKLQNCIDLIKNNANFLYIYNLTNASSPNKIVSIEEYQDHFKIIPPWVSVEFYADAKKYSALSGGEKMFFSFMINLLYQINNIQRSGKYQTINIFLDEVEFGLHPDWQKKFVAEILFSLQDFGIKLNIYFATHSPFILSDIPKENVIFLDNGEEKYPFKESEQTFGANIHTLLSHGFFMRDGLMGEFAKSKINAIIDFYNEVEKHTDNETKKVELKIQYEEKKEAFWNIQSIIGEAYLKQVVKNHLIEIEKILLGKDEAKNAEISRIKVYLKSLEND